MKLDILKTSLLAMVFAIGFNGLAQASDYSSDSDSGSESDSSRRSHSSRRFHSDDHGIQDRTGHHGHHQRGYASEDCGSMEEALGYMAQFKAKPKETLLHLYGMLRHEDSKMTAGQALLQIITKQNSHKQHCEDQPAKPSKTAADAIIIDTTFNLNTCQLASVVTRGAAAYADYQKTMGIKDGPSILQGINFMANIMGKAGVKVGVQGKFTTTITIDTCANPCPPCATAKPCCEPCGDGKPCEGRSVDKGTEQVVGRVINAFSRSEITECAVDLLMNFSKFGTEAQQHMIRKMLSRR